MVFPVAGHLQRRAASSMPEGCLYCSGQSEVKIQRGALITIGEVPYCVPVGDMFERCGTLASLRLNRRLQDFGAAGRLDGWVLFGGDK
jgi:hypothetical protein